MRIFLCRVPLTWVIGLSSSYSLFLLPVLLLVLNLCFPKTYNIRLGCSNRTKDNKREQKRTKRTKKTKENKKEQKRTKENKESKGGTATETNKEYNMKKVDLHVRRHELLEVLSDSSCCG